MTNQKINIIYLKIISLLNEYDQILPENSEQFNYVKDGNLDSFELINFITDIEIEFGFQISPEDLANENCHTLLGLARLISDSTQEL